MTTTSAASVLPSRTAGVVAVPGFGDTTTYWLDALGLDVPTTVSVSWAGMWDVPEASQPYSLAVSQIAAQSEGRIVVGHSLGARAALEASVLVQPRGLVLLGPGIGPLSIISDGALARWADEGGRPTKRRDPRGEGELSFSVPYAFAEDLVEHGPTPVARGPIRMVLFTGDSFVRNETIRAYADRCEAGQVELVEIEGPHRFWQDEMTSGAVRDLVDGWLDELGT